MNNTQEQEKNEIPFIHKDGSVEMFPVTSEIKAVFWKSFETSSKKLGQQRIRQIFNYFNEH